MTRFQTMREASQFRCPDNDVVANFNGSITTTYGPMISYYTSMLFLLKYNNGAPSTAIGRTVGRASASSVQNPPQSYSCRVSQVGDAARKIFISDGGRYSNLTTFPDVNLAVTSSNGGAFADQGAPFKFSNCWYRGTATGNGATGGTVPEPRIFGYRHGFRTKGGRTDSYRFNAAFFDGHVETLGDLEGSNPFFWAPKGSLLSLNSSQVWNDTAKLFLGTTSPPDPYTVPW